jgi:Protein of unknown function (DUF2892).
MKMATTPKTMCTNIGGMERMLRVIAGIAILYMGPGLGLGMWSLIGLVPLFSGTTGWCPLSLPFGIGSCWNQLWALSWRVAFARLSWF